MTGIKNWAREKSKTLKDDLIAGFIVAIVALPLAIGFAMASGVPLTMGIIAAAIGGFFAAAIGGSDYQISGPSGTLVVITLSIVAAHGLEGMLLATFLAGVILILLGIFKLGKIIEYIPSPVIIGFTAGIAFMIFFGQLNNFFGINPSYPQGAGFMAKTWISLTSIGAANLAAIILALITIAILIVMPRLSKKIPGSIVAVIATTALAATLTAFFKVKTVGDIGNFDLSIAIPNISNITWPLVIAVLPAALTIAAIVAIESLLTAVVADGMTDTKHNPNKELIGQGTANIMSSAFGGMPMSGATARTATNIRNGAKTRLSGMLHAAFILLFILALGSLAIMIPLAALAGVLMFVAFNMVDWGRIRMLLKTPMSDVAVMITTFLLTIFISITVAIEVGLILAAILFMKRMSDLYNIESTDAKTDGADDDSKDPNRKRFDHPQISIYTMNGPLFFGAASRLDQQLANIPGGHKPIKIIRMKYVPVIDATGLAFIESTWKKHKKMGGKVYFTSCTPNVMKIIRDCELDKKIGEDSFTKNTKSAIVLALKQSHKMRKEPETVTPEELSKYNLTKFDEEDAEAQEQLHDVDPVQEIFDSVGITTAHNTAKQGVEKAQEIGIEGINTARKIRKKSIDNAQKLGETGISTVSKLGKSGIRKAKEIGETGVDAAINLGEKGITTAKTTVQKIESNTKKTIKKVTKKKKW